MMMMRMRMMKPMMMMMRRRMMLMMMTITMMMVIDYGKAPRVPKRMALMMMMKEGPQEGVVPRRKQMGLS